MDAFLGQFYEDKPVPRLVLLSHDAPNRELLAEAFCVKSGHRVEIATPKRGEKRELVAHALTNAREALGRRMAEGSAQAKLLAQAWPRRSSSTARRSGSRSTTTPTSWAPTRWAA